MDKIEKIEYFLYKKERIEKKKHTEGDRFVFGEKYAEMRIYE